MSKLWQIGLVSLLAVVWTIPAHAAFIGPTATARTNATDGSGNVGWVAALDEWKVPEDGYINGFQYYKTEAQNAGSGGNLRFLVLRLTSGDGFSPNTSIFDVLYVSPAIDTTGLIPGQYGVSTGSPVAVQEGDLFGFIGRGVSFDIQVTSPVERIFYSTAENNPVLGGGAATSAIVVPTVGSSFTVKPASAGAWAANSYNWYTSNGGRRVYSLSADFMPIPEPTSLTLIALAGVGAVVLKRSVQRNRR